MNKGRLKSVNIDAGRDVLFLFKADIIFVGI